MAKRPDDFQAILRQRAERLSRPVEEKRQRTVKLIVFSLGEEFYAFEAEHVREVVHAEKIAVVPCAPEFVEGVINLRGNTVTVVNLAGILDIGDKARVGERWVIIVNVDRIEAALHIDVVQEILDVPQSAIGPPLPTLERRPAQYVKAQARIDDTLVGILNLASILATDRVEAGKECPTR